MTRGSLSAQQVHQLLLPVNEKRVMFANGHSHLSQQDVTAHLIRVLGFGNFDIEVVNVECMFEHVAVKNGEPVIGKWDVGYRALVRLTVRNADGELVARYENGATATAENQKLGAAHDLAYKSAISLSMKRCTINLGDQFGLSLYNKGQTAPLVIGTLVHPKPPETDKPDTPAADVQANVPEQVGDGDDGEHTQHLDESIGDPDDPAPTGLAAVIAERKETR